MVVLSKMDYTSSSTFQNYDGYLDSESYKRLCANENRKASQKLLKNYCQSRYNASDNCQASTNSNFRKETLSSHHHSTFPISTNYLPGDSSNIITSFNQSSKVTTFPILNNSNISIENSNSLDTSYSSLGSNSSSISYNNSFSPDNNISFLTSKKSDNKLEEENNHITRPVIQLQLNMLHRSPSGAARRIRQRREENSQRQFPILSSPNSSSFNNKSFSSEPVTGSTIPSRETMIEGNDDYLRNECPQIDYRDLMNSSSYKSILPEDDFNISYSRPPQRILCNSSSFTSNANKIEESSPEEPSNPEIIHTTSPQFQEVDQEIITMESNKFLDKVDFSSLLSSNTNTTTTTTTTKDECSQSNVIIPPVPPKRTSIASSGDNSSYSSPISNTGMVNNNILNDHKPTIQVHPMPAPRKSHIQCEDSLINVEKSDDKRIPPPLPKKPSKFIFKGETNAPIIFNTSEPYYHHQQSHSTSIPPSPAPRTSDQYKESPMVRQRFDSLPSLSSSHTPHGSNNKENERNNESGGKESTYSNLFIKNQNGACSLSVSTSNIYSSAFMGTSTSMSSAQSTESLNQLFTSPSMLSLQNAYKNYPLMTEQDLEILEDKRKNLVESLSRKMRVLEQERVMIDEDIMENEEFKKRFLQKLDLDPQMLVRLNNHIAQAKTLSLLETKVNLQLEKLENYLSNENDMDPTLLEFCQSRRNRLIEQLSDSSMLRNLHRSRDVEIENILLSKYFLQPQQMEEWRIYKDSLVRLLTEKRQMEDRLSQARHQLSILDNLALQASALMRSLTTPNIHTRETSSDGNSMISSSNNSRANTLDSGEINVGDLRTSTTINNTTNNTSTALIV